MESQDPVPGTVPVTDRRPTPAGVLPRRFQTWIMAGLATGIVLIILLAGEPRPPAGPAQTPATQAPTADRLRDYQERLRAMEARAATEATQPAVDPSEAFSGEPPAPRAEDPLVAERRRRDYDSLFASNVVLSRRNGSGRPDDGAVPSRSTPTDGRAGPAPSLDAIADAVVRATVRDGGPPTERATAEQRASPSEVASTAAPQGGRRPTPEATDPIRAAGPLHRLLEGTFIDATLTNRLDGAGVAPVVCLVTNPVYAHAGHVVVIPPGARVLGEIRPVQAFGETRLAVAFHRLVMPDGRTYRLDQFRGLNQLGDVGLRDRVNQHYWSTFGAAGAVGLISGLAQWLGTAGVSRATGGGTVVVTGGIAEASQASQQVLGRFLNRLPTVTIREGHRVKVYLSSDLDLPAYEVGPGTSW